MKKLLQYFDIVYFIGIIALMMGYYFATSTLMNGDFLYQLSLLLFPFAFIYFGLIVILIEFIVTKHYKLVWTYFKENLKTGTTSYVILLSVFGYLLSLFLLTPKYSLFLLFILSTIFILYVLVKKSSKVHVFTLSLLLLLFSKIIMKLLGIENFDYYESIIFNINTLFYFGFILTSLVLLIKRTHTFQGGTALKVLLSFILVNIMMYNVQNTIFEIEYYHKDESSQSEDALFPYNNCPAGYDLRITGHGGNFNMECVKVNEGLVSYQDNGMINLGIIYLSFIIISLIYSKIPMTLSSIQKKHIESAKEMQEFLENECISEKNRETSI